ncbi:MAG: hypothetical protein A2X77_00385 [Gammaproteobacteria bacterium GWE2_42_36]|nr:MAG: hypothetical protein A2X77_00385 [Gammaproteobacteria bacterium GWE2_42_36]HCU05719.1 hypothetical protein [Coxiellaceae bacterium]
MDFIHSSIQILLHLDAYLTIWAIKYGAWMYGLLFLIIFCETGLILAAILPGDSLLFATGAIAATGALNIYYLLALLITAALVGNTLNFWIGNKIGHWIIAKHHRFIKKKHLKKTHAFYEKHGKKTIIIGSFLPIIRTFAPFVAGMGEMKFISFMIANITGVLLWMMLILYGSYLFGNIPWIKLHFSVMVIAIVFISLLPAFVELLRNSLKRS